MTILREWPDPFILFSAAWDLYFYNIFYNLTKNGQILLSSLVVHGMNIFIISSATLGVILKTSLILSKFHIFFFGLGRPSPLQRSRMQRTHVFGGLCHNESFLFFFTQVKGAGTQ